LPGPEFIESIRFRPLVFDSVGGGLHVSRL
jgi:hypothetical protein